MAVKFMKAGGLAALAAGLAMLAMPASAQERGQGRWSRGGDASATAQGGSGWRGRSEGGSSSGWRGNGNSGGNGNWQGNGGRRGFGGQQATPSPAPQAQAQPQRNWSRGGVNGGGRWNDGNRGADTAAGWNARRGQSDARSPNVPQADVRRNWGGSVAGNQWQGRNRSYVDPGRKPTYRDPARSGEMNRWRNDGNDNRWRGANTRGNNAWGDRDGRADSWRDNRRGFAGNWNRDWRRDNRYDWRGYRSANRDVYRLGAYHSPYRNYSYRRLNAGFYLDTLFFSSRYLINDPWQYRLPPADGPYSWVRYYDDALLVDTYSGEVIDVIYDFFW